MDNLTLLQLVYTRISHDLSGCAGAIYNGAELLEEDLSFAEESSSLIKDSAETLMARLRFFRQTFGLPKESEDTTAAYLKTFSMPFSLNQECDNNLQRCLIMCLTDYFYKGAEFKLSSSRIEISGDAKKDIQPLKSILTQGVGEQTAANASAFYAYHLAQQMNSRLQIEQTEIALQIKLDFDNAL